MLKIVGVLAIFIGFETALARPTAEERSIQREAFWSITTSLYMSTQYLAQLNTAESNAATNTEVIHTKQERLLAFFDQIATSSGSIAGPLQLKKIDMLGEMHQIRQDVLTKQFQRSLVKVTDVQSRWLQAFSIDIAPVVSPSLSVGQLLFEEHCASCHGLSFGRGIKTGPLEGKLRTKPKDLSRLDGTLYDSPFGVYSLMVHGIDQTEMPPYVEQLSVDEMWSLAFYVTAIPYLSLNFTDYDKLPHRLDEKMKAFAGDLSLIDLTLNNNQQLVEKIHNLSFTCGTCLSELAYLRGHLPFQMQLSRMPTTAADPRESAESKGLFILLMSVLGVFLLFLFVLRYRRS